MKPVFLSTAALLAAMALVAPLVPAHAQAVAEQAELQSIGGMIVSGGTMNIIFFGILGMFSIWSAAVVLERMVNLRREKILPRAFIHQLSQISQSRSMSADGLRLVCDSGQSPACRILRAGVIRAGRPLNEVEKAMEDAAAREMSMLRGKNRPLNIVGNIAPLVGLLGTVVGMIMAFQISSHQGLGKAEQLAEGIYLALMTTAAGLTIAIPCLLFAAWFQARGERYMCDVADSLTDALPCFAALERQRPTAFLPEGHLETPSGRQDGSDVTGRDRHDHERVELEHLRKGPESLSVRERFLRDGVFEPAKS